MKLTRLTPVVSFLVSASGLLAADTNAFPATTVPPASIGGTPATLVPPASSPATPVNATGESAVYLDIGFGTRPVSPSRITVPLGEKLRIVAPLMDDGTNYVWLKNGRAIPGAPNANMLVLDYVTSDDAATYHCQFSTPTSQPRSAQALVLGVGPVERLVNLSTRAFISAGTDQSLTTGFVVGGGAGQKRIILRVIGPSLAAFGVASPLRKPVLRIFDANGRLYENGYAYPAVVGGLTYQEDLAKALARSGAFTIPSGTDDIVEMRPFAPGSYTATVTSADGTAGNVLLEIYEVP